MDRRKRVGRRLTTPRAAALAGILFSVLLTITYVLLRSTVPEDPTDAGEWLSTGSGRVDIALWLVPFAGIAFLWFIGVIRDRLGEHEDQFFSSVLFGSGLLFIAMAFIASALAGALIASYQLDPVATIENGIYTVERETIFRITNVFGVRMAGVFMFSAGTIWLRSGTMPRWMVVITYTVAIVQLFSLGFTLWFTLLFPAWVLIVSVHFLLYPPNLAEDADDTPAESASA
ncbi:MAG: hypothetical protein WCA90_14340 [Ilumatobacteraceae bacterium]